MGEDDITGVPKYKHLSVRWLAAKKWRHCLRRILIGQKKVTELARSVEVLFLQSWLIDDFVMHPDLRHYTYFSYRFDCRRKGIGWRLDTCT